MMPVAVRLGASAGGAVGERGDAVRVEEGDSWGVEQLGASNAAAKTAGAGAAQTMSGVAQTVCVWPATGSTILVRARSRSGATRVWTTPGGMEETRGDGVEEVWGDRRRRGRGRYNGRVGNQGERSHGGGSSRRHA